jgi:glycosyltransferase involved in cell wall biosynthesis
MSKKTIVVNFPGRKGGGAVYAYEMTKSLIENGSSVYAIIAKDIENLMKWQKLELGDLVLLPTYSNNLDYVINTIKLRFMGLSKLRSNLKNKFKGINIDAVYIPMIQPWSGMINCIFKKCRKIVTLHDPKPHSGSNWYFNYLCYKCASKADDIVILSEKFREYTQQHYNKAKDKVHVIPHGIFDYYKNFETSENTINYDSKKINFLFFGLITKYKGLHVLAKAYERLSKDFDNITLSVVGNGNFDEYREEFSKLKDTTIVNRWIKDEEVGTFFKGENIVTVLPYIDATQSGVIPIAMEYESIVIASNTGGLSEQVKDGVTGYLFETGNPEALYEKMKYVIENYDKQRPVIDNARKYIKSLSWDVLGARLLEIIKQ